MGDGHTLRRLMYGSLFLLMTFPLLGIADDRVDTIYFAEEANWPPYTPNAYGIAKEGLSLELMQAIFSHLGIKIEIDLLPMQRVLLYLQEGQKDAVTVITKSPERLKFLEYTDVIISKDRGLIYYSTVWRDPFEWESFEDFRGLRIGFTAGHNYPEEIRQAADLYDFKFIEVPRVVQNFDMLLAGRVDIVMAAESTAKDILRDPKYQGKIIPASKPTNEINFHIAFSKKSPAKVLIPQVNAVIQKMKADGSLEAIIDKY